MRVLVTRARRQAEETARRLVEAGHEPLVAPLMVVQFAPPVAPPPAEYQGVILTSRPAVEALERAGLEWWRDLPAFCVGETTARAAAAAGFGSVITGPGDANGLAQTIIGHGMAGGPPFVYPGAVERAFDFGAALAGRGLAVETVDTYRMVPVDTLPDAAAVALRDGAVDAALVYSPRSCAVLIDAARGSRCLDQLERVTLVGISRAALASARTAGLKRIAVADKPNETSLLARLDRLAGKD